MKKRIMDLKNEDYKSSINQSVKLGEQSQLKEVIRALHLTFELIIVSKRNNIGVRELAET